LQWSNWVKTWSSTLRHIDDLDVVVLQIQTRHHDASPLGIAGIGKLDEYLLEWLCRCINALNECVIKSNSLLVAIPLPVGKHQHDCDKCNDQNMKSHPLWSQ